MKSMTFRRKSPTLSASDRAKLAEMDTRFSADPAELSAEFCPHLFLLRRYQDAAQAALHAVAVAKVDASLAARAHGLMSPEVDAAAWQARLAEGAHFEARQMVKAAHEVLIAARRAQGYPV